MATNSRTERRRLAPDLDVSRVVTGLWQVADMERGGRQLDLGSAAQAMAPYVEAGFTSFDMADHYGSAEEIAGRFVASGGQAELLTKWVPEPGPIRRETVRAAVTRALGRLRRERLELLQFHAWRFSDPAWLDALFFLDELRAEGLVGHLGAVNFDTVHLRIAVASGIRLVSNQVVFSLLDRRAAGRMSTFCREHGVQLLAYGTLAGGFLTERWLDRPAPSEASRSTWSEMKYHRFIETLGGWERFQALARAVSTVARKHQVSMASVACRAILDEPAVGAVIVGARLGERSHLEDNVRIFSLLLDEEDRKAIGTAAAALSPIPGDCGDEYRRPPYLTATGDLSQHVESFPPPYQTREGPGRTLCLSGTPWEPLAGYSRAVRKGSRIAVSGTTATHGSRSIGGGDPAAQTHFVIDKLEGALESLGARLEDVVRTRVFVRRIQDWEAVARAHGERFGHIQPANTLVEAALVSEDALVEIEADAEL
jgi:aryl-alcohol dehydrogenase-like predicted oxidoreductase/enamine deaminase RidA (YjgF/YER057c/UK114 family)